MSSIVQIKDSAYDGLKSLTVYGNTVQNLWSNLASQTVSGVTITANDDGSITLSGTATTTVAPVLTTYTLRPGVTYTLSVDKALGSHENTFFLVCNQPDSARHDFLKVHSGSASASVPSDPTNIGLGFRVNAGDTVSGTYRVMLNEGSTAKPWCPPGLNSVGDGGSVEVMTAGKNLVSPQDKSVQVRGIDITCSNQEFSFNGTANGSGGRTVYFWEGAIGYGTYTLGAFGLSNSDNVSVNVTDKGAGNSIAATTGAQSTFSVLGYTEIGIGFNFEEGDSVDVDGVTVQIERGSTKTDYEKGAYTTTPIDLQSHTLNALPDGTRDELHIDGGGNVVLEKRCGDRVVDGTNLAATSMVGDGKEARINVGDVVPSSGKDDYSDLILSDKLPSYDGDDLWLAKHRNGCAISGTEAEIGARCNDMSTISAFNTWFQQNNMRVVYKLAEPQTIDLGTITPPKLRKKPLVNTIWANGTAEGTGFSLAPEIDCEYNRWSTYCDGFKTHGKHSYFDMGCCIAARDTGTPEKKSVTATVPYMSGFYDLSKLYGAIAFEARQLMYRFEFVEDSREELQQKKSQFLEWLSQVHDEEIADDDIPGRHFIGSLSEWEFEEGEEGQSGSLEVTFNCQPFLEADEDTTKTCNAGSNTVTVKGQPVNAYAKTSSGTATIQIGGATQSVGTTEIRLSVQLQPGDNAVTVTGSPVVLRWKELTA